MWRTFSGAVVGFENIPKSNFVVFIRTMLYYVRMKTTNRKKLRQEILSGRPLVRSELEAQGLRGNTLSELAARGRLRRVARGIYTSVSGELSSTYDYELASKVSPAGVFTLLSALRLHGLTDENPRRMTMAIPAKSHAPKSVLPLDFVYMSETLILSDVETRVSDGTSIRVFTLERTIAECFKARKKIGLGIAVSALKEASQRKRIDYAKLWDVMKRCRMTKVMSPYLEGFV